MPRLALLLAALAAMAADVVAAANSNASSAVGVPHVTNAELPSPSDVVGSEKEASEPGLLDNQQSQELQEQQEQQEVQQPQQQQPRLRGTKTSLLVKSFAAAAAGGFNEAEALRFGYLAAAAYCPDVESWSCAACRNVPGVTEVQRFEGILGGVAVVGKLDGACFVAFRGTADVPSAVADLGSFVMQPWGNGNVGIGILKGYESVAPSVKEALRSRGCSSVNVVGHSLGGFSAAVAMYDLNAAGFNVGTSYSFGAPMVGDDAFINSFNAAGLGSRLFRVTHGHDPIVHLGPIGVSRNVGIEVFYPGDSTQGYRVCRADNMGCSMSMIPFPTDFLGDHVNYLRPAMSVAMAPWGC